MKQHRAIFHCHSNLSADCSVSLAAIGRKLKALDVTHLFLTEHDCGDFSRRIEGVTIVPSQEITTCDGEIIGIFLKRPIKSGLSAITTIKLIHRQGGLAVVPHPFDRLRTKKLSEKQLFQVIGKLDVIEIFNARTVWRGDDRIAIRLADTYNKRVIWGSDAHTLYEYGKVVIDGVDCTSVSTFLDSLEHAKPILHYAPLWVHGVTKYVKWKKRFSRP